MKRALLLLAAFAAVLVSCNPVDPEDEPTEKEKQMVPAEMTWELDSVLVIYDYHTSEESSEMLYPSDGIDIWSYTFYPYTYHFPKDLCFTNEMTGESIYLAQEYKQDFCKYICTYQGGIISAGYLCYYRDLFTFNGVQEGGWVEFMIRETDTNWEVPVWTCSFNVVEDDSGYVHERHTEYYSRRR